VADNNKNIKIIGKDKTKNGMLLWTKETIPTSLTNIEDKILLKDAVRNFKNILAWSGDKTVQYPLMVAREIVEKGIQCEGLRDEIYVQIIKQITNNPTPESTTQLWHLIQLCLLHFPPTPLFEHYLEAWLRDKGGEQHWYTVSTLHDTQEHGVKEAVPSAEEIEAMTKQQYSSKKEHVNVHRPNLPPKTNIDEVVAINNKRAVGAVGPRPSMRSLAVAPSSPHPLPSLPQSVAHPPPSSAPAPTPSHVTSGGGESASAPQGGRPMPQVPGGTRPMPQPGRGAPPTGYPLPMQMYLQK